MSIMIRMKYVIAILLTLLPLLLMRRIYVGSNKFSMLLDHDSTENYCERGTHSYRYLNFIKFPLFMLKCLKLHMFFLPLLIALCINKLFIAIFPCIGIRV